jgi:hypothetical protein
MREKPTRAPRLSFVPLLKLAARIVTFLLIPCLVTNSTRASFVSDRTTTQRHVVSETLQTEFLSQALSADVQSALQPLHRHHADGFHQATVVAKQETNRHAQEFDDHLGAMVITQQKIRELIAMESDTPAGSLAHWKSRWLGQMKRFDFLVELIPFGENDWLPELVRLVTDYLEKSAIRLKDYTDVGGSLRLLPQVLTALGEELKPYREKLTHGLILDAEGLFYFLNGFGPLPERLRVDPKPEDQEYFRNQFFNQLLLGMLDGLLSIANPDDIRRPEGRHTYLKAMTDGARQKHLEHDRNALKRGELVAMQPPSESDKGKETSFVRKIYYARAMAFDQQGQLWVNSVSYYHPLKLSAHGAAQISYLPADQGDFKSFAQRSSVNVLAIDHQDRLFVAAQDTTYGDSYIQYFDKESGQWKDFAKRSDVRAMAFDGAGRLWIEEFDSTYGMSYLSYYDQDQQKFINAHKLHDVHAMAFDKEGRLWVAQYDTTYGHSYLAFFDPLENKWVPFDRQYHVDAMAFDPEGRLWFGSFETTYGYTHISHYNTPFVSPAPTVERNFLPTIPNTSQRQFSAAA